MSRFKFNGLAENIQVLTIMTRTPFNSMVNSNCSDQEISALVHFVIFLNIM